jgi:hypothetical protein
MAEKTEQAKPAGNTRIVEALYTSYLNKDGEWVDAERGNEIEVHPSDLARYDKADAARNVSGVNL